MEAFLLHAFETDQRLVILAMSCEPCEQGVPANGIPERKFFESLLSLVKGPAFGVHPNQSPAHNMRVSVQQAEIEEMSMYSAAFADVLDLCTCLQQGNQAVIWLVIHGKLFCRSMRP
jgi:hypothetical protein